MAHKEVKALFLLGADSGAIPDCAVSPGLFTDQDRQPAASWMRSTRSDSPGTRFSASATAGLLPARPPAAIPDCAVSPGLFTDQDRDALSAMEVELAPPPPGAGRPARPQGPCPPG